MIIIILGQHKDTFEKKVFKAIYNLQSFFKHKNCSSIFQLQNTKSYPERGYYLLEIFKVKIMFIYK